MDVIRKGGNMYPSLNTAPYIAHYFLHLQRVAAIGWYLEVAIIPLKNVYCAYEYWIYVFYVNLMDGEHTPMECIVFTQVICCHRFTAVYRC